VELLATTTKFLVPFQLQVDPYTINLRMKLVIAVTAVVFLVGTTALVG